MSQDTLSDAPGDAALDAASKLTPDAIEAILQDFRGWLERAAHRAESGEQPPAHEAEFSWQQLAAEFTALRQEVNLQTRAARAQLEQNAETLQQLGESARSLDEAHFESASEGASDEALRPLLKTLVDVFDAMTLARREVERVQKQLEQLSASSAVATRPQVDQVRVDPSHPPAPSRRRWWPWGQATGSSAVPVITVTELKLRLVQQERELALYRQAQGVGGSGIGQAQQVLASILVGYTMSLQRLERALAQHDFEPIACTGEPFDPECMEAVDVVSVPGQQGTEVVEEVRRGYRWRGRLFRPAQVRVSRP